MMVSRAAPPNPGRRFLIQSLTAQALTATPDPAGRDGHRVPEMIVSYADAAALILANLAPGGEMSRRRVGLALPAGMWGEKQQWGGTPSAA